MQRLHIFCLYLYTPTSTPVYDLSKERQFVQLEHIPVNYDSAKILIAEEYRTRIVKGFECSPMDHPYLVSIGMTRKSHFCGGSLLSRNLVLTAGHCCEEEGYFRIFTGLTRVRSLAQSAYVAEIYLHPNYSKDPLSTDLCVLKLSSEILENEYTKYVTIINSSLWDEWVVGQNCRAAVAMGFGYQGVKYENGTPKDRNAPFNPIMQCVQLSIIPPDVCQLAMDDTMFCAIDPLSEGRDPCQGDSGGPLICQDVQIGIISAGFGCGLEGFASIYTRVDLFSEYLKELVVAKSGSTSLSIIIYMLLSFIVILTYLV